MKQYVKKSLVLYMILLFVMLSVSSAVSASSFPLLKNSDVEITIHQADGSSTTSQFSLDQDKIQTLRDLALSGSQDELLSYVIDCGLVDGSFLEKECEQLKDMSEDLEIGILKLDKIKAGLPFIVSSLSKVSSVTILGGSKRIGVTPILRVIEKLLPINLKRAELLATTTGLFGVVSTQNVLCNKALAGIFVGVIYLGFIGVSIKIPGLMHIFSGYAALTISSGIGLKIRNVRSIDGGLFS